MRDQPSAADPENLRAALDRATEHLAATREILRVISESRDDETPVFDAILNRAERLCDAQGSGLLLLNPAGTHLGILASRGEDRGSFPLGTQFELDGPSGQSIAVRERRVVHYEDLRQTDLYQQGHEGRRKLVDVEGILTHLHVPLLSGDKAFGTITLSRRVQKPFSPSEIALVESFADQAVIAIENGRQFRALQTRLERASATREILEVISQSRADDAPVFDAILKNAATLCAAPMAWLMLTDAAQCKLTLAAYHGLTRRALNIGDTWQIDQNPDWGLSRAIIRAQSVQDDDLAQSAPYLAGNPATRQLVDEEGLRTRLTIPLVSNGKGIGCLVLSRREYAPFQPDEIALLEIFAEQAVIAIENGRQFRELQNRLAREAATGEVLSVISRSRDDDLPVFRAILDRAQRLCNAQTSGLQLLNEAGSHVSIAATSGLDGGNFPRGMEVPMSANTPVIQAIREDRMVHVEDSRETESYKAGDEYVVRMVDDDGVLTRLVVPLKRGDHTFGTMSLSRLEQRPFNADEIALAETFASQAVIAIENVRQFRELQNRLAREAATGEVLSVISQSRDDDQPVFETILENAQALCDAPMSGLILATSEDSFQTLAAQRGISDGAIARFYERKMPMDGAVSYAAKCILEGELIAFHDMRESPLYGAGSPVVRAMVDEIGIRSVLFVPLLLKDKAIGCITLFRYAVDPFEDRLVDLVKTFAAQAVIAIENVRQFRELQTRLEREAATREVLEVISRSRDDQQPVFDVVLRKSAHLCSASNASLNIVNEDRTQVIKVADWGHQTSDQLPAGRTAWPMESENAPSACVREGRIVHLHDMADTDLYRSGDSNRVAAVDGLGIRTFLAVPLFSGGETIGCISTYRHEVRPFAADEIALVETFAAQAVIAIENVRQFKALESLNAELGDRVTAQVDEIERMGRLKRFLPAAVANTVVSQGSEEMLASHRALLGVLFCDIRGFTAFCETAEPEETIEVLQSYHEEMGRLIAEHGAGVDTRAGDGIMVLFNDPLPCDDPAGDALRLGLAMRTRMQELSQTWRRHGHRLGFGVGISLGYATVGMVGSAGRYDYTASGTAVNLAARLCDRAEDGEILLSPRAYAAVERDFAAQSVGEISLKGIHAPVEVFRVTGAG